MNIKTYSHRGVEFEVVQGGYQMPDGGYITGNWQCSCRLVTHIKTLFISAYGSTEEKCVDNMKAKIDKALDE